MFLPDPDVYYIILISHTGEQGLHDSREIEFKVEIRIFKVTDDFRSARQVRDVDICGNPESKMRFRRGQIIEITDLNDR